MIRINGDKKEDINISDLKTDFYTRVILDLGTGDGRFIFEEAKKNPKNLYIGIDPAGSQLEIYSKKANKERLTNCYFILGSFENLPEDFNFIFDELHINFPWGSLLKITSDPYEYYLSSFTKLFKRSSSAKTLSIFFGYDFSAEPKEVSRLGLPELTEEYIKDKMIPKYEKAGFKLIKFEVLNKSNIKKLASSWGKKLAFGQSRPIYNIVFKLC